MLDAGPGTGVRPLVIPEGYRLTQIEDAVSHLGIEKAATQGGARGAVRRRASATT